MKAIICELVPRKKLRKLIKVINSYKTWKTRKYYDILVNNLNFKVHLPTPLSENVSCYTIACSRCGNVVHLV